MPEEKARPSQGRQVPAATGLLIEGCPIRRGNQSCRRGLDGNSKQPVWNVLRPAGKDRFGRVRQTDRSTFRRVMSSSAEALCDTPLPLLLREGETCWRISSASRAALLVDGEEYFSVLRQALLQAREQILIAGWDFDSRILLSPQRSDDHGQESAGAPAQLGKLLGYLIGTRPGLQIHVVRWDYHWLYRHDREGDTREQLEKLGVHFYEHSGHPITGCVHHKVVVIDDVLAFCGGIDLTHQRWDSCRHEPEDSKRRDHSGQYTPVHDTQLCVSGPVAARLGAYLRDSWPSGTTPPSAPAARSEFWPPRLRVDFENIRTGICRTLPASVASAGAREIEGFYLAAIGATRRCLYIENQYFTNTRLARVIANQCRREPRLQCLLVGMDRPKTQAELHTMGYGLTQFRQVLAAAGVSERVPLVAALTGDLGINLHSKLAIFDDRWLTTGSANLNRRSMGFDIECNLVLEATTVQHREQMESLRNRLIAEHLGMHVEELAETIRLHGVARLPDLARGARRLIHPKPLRPDPVLGRMLAPLFDREELLKPPTFRLPTYNKSVAYRPLLLLVIASLTILVRGLPWGGLPLLTSLQQRLAQMLAG